MDFIVIRLRDFGSIGGQGRKPLQVSVTASEFQSTPQSDLVVAEAASADAFSDAKFEEEAEILSLWLARVYLTASETVYSKKAMTYDLPVSTVQRSCRWSIGRACANFGCYS
jgi:hypothetical protein